MLEGWDLCCRIGSNLISADLLVMEGDVAWLGREIPSTRSGIKAKLQALVVEPVAQGLSARGELGWVPDEALGVVALRAHPPAVGRDDDVPNLVGALVNERLGIGLDDVLARVAIVAVVRVPSAGARMVSFCRISASPAFEIIPHLRSIRTLELCAR